MFKRMGLRSKMLVGSCTPLILVVFLGAFIYISIQSLLENNKAVDHTHEVIQTAMDIEASAVDMETGMRGYLLAGQEVFLAPYIDGGKRFNTLLAEQKKTVSDNPAQVQLLGEIQDNINAWKNDVTEPTIELRRLIGKSKTMDDMRDLVREAKGKVYFDKFREQIKTFTGREQVLMEKRKKAAEKSNSIAEIKETAKMVDHTHTVLEMANQILSAGVDMETGMRGYLLAGKEEFLGPYKGGKASFNSLTDQLKQIVSDNPAQVQLIDQIKTTINDWQTNATEPAIALRREIGEAKSMNDMADLVAQAKGKKYFDKFRDQVHTFINREAVLMKKRQEDASSTAANTITMVIVGTLLTIAIALIIAFFLASSITGVFKQIFQGLKTLSSFELEGVRLKFADVIKGLTSGSGIVSSASQQMAGGASEQAASLEETSASLEEMTSMTRANAENANEANNLMKSANEVVIQANSSMGEVTTSMEEITKASEETSKIIKTIDEIAFQTNLLALNAAVEAARAGEAGAGFAVVADEVRNLAMRAAEAAKNTAVMIEDTVKKVSQGSEQVTKTNDAFKEVAESAGKVADLVNEITAASTEQSEGIEQINKAIVDMDKVTQQNAAGTEELSSQAEELGYQVGVLLEIVEGSNQVKKVANHDVKQLVNKPRNTPMAAPVSAKDVIPMDDDFVDF